MKVLVQGRVLGVRGNVFHAAFATGLVRFTAQVDLSLGQAFGFLGERDLGLRRVSWVGVFGEGVRRLDGEGAFAFEGKGGFAVGNRRGGEA